MQVDLELDNYSLQDLLNLFKLEYNFDIDGLRSAKKLVLKLHPDKCGLDKQYFLFYSGAFRIIKNIYDFRNKKEISLNNENSKIEYLADTEEDRGKRFLTESLLKNDKKNFHKWFNEAFEKINVVDEERKVGYGDWFKSEEDIDTTTTSYNMMHQKISEKKEALSAIVKKQDICDTQVYGFNNYQQLDGSVPESYGSDIFSNLQFEDLKIAHTETVVPVGESDYNNVLKFNNVENLRQHRNGENMNNKPLSKNEANNYLNNKTLIDDKNNTQRAYKLAKQDEEMEKANKSWWANLQRLK